ncbi:MAG: DUF5615 family PIN-like protein [Anaerolineae bacterium]|nr:DUF5615 family PIN-like protein [Anaerolineae bacterium]
MARLYSNENFALPVVVELRKFGHDIVTSLDSGRANLSIPDADVLAYATEQQRAVLTFDRYDFKKLHILNSNHAGIIACTDDTNTSALAERIHRLLESTQDLSQQFLNVYKPDK